jgi:hypothetical protein
LEFKAKLCSAAQIPTDKTELGVRWSSKRSFVRPRKFQPTKQNWGSLEFKAKLCSAAQIPTDKTELGFVGVQSEALFGRAKLRFELQPTKYPTIFQMSNKKTALYFEQKKHLWFKTWF